MVLPIIAIASALLAKQEQDAAQIRAEKHGIDRDEAATLAAIRAQRASRAGDSGYMQTAARGMTGYPVPQPLMSSQMIGEVGKALMSQKDAPKLADTSANTTAPQLRANEEAYRSAFTGDGSSNALDDVDNAISSFDKYEGW